MVLALVLALVLTGAGSGAGSGSGSCSVIGSEYPRAPLYRYWKPAGSDHFYTTNVNEIGTAVGGSTGKGGYI